MRGLGPAIWMLCLAAVWGFSEAALHKAREAEIQYERGEFEKARALYVEARRLEPASEELLFNIGNTHYQLKDFEEASRNYRALTGEGGKELAAKSFYNLGNTAYRREDHDAAIRNYRDALRISPVDEDAKYNLELLLKKKKEEEEKKSPSSPSREPSPGKGADKSEQQAGGADGKEREPQKGGGQGEGERDESEERDGASQGAGGERDESQRGKEPSEGRGDQSNERDRESRDRTGDSGERPESRERGPDQAESTGKGDTQPEAGEKPSEEPSDEGEDGLGPIREGQESAPQAPLSLVGPAGVQEADTSKTGSVKILDALAQDEFQYLNLRQERVKPPEIIRDRDW